jgi:ribosomal protein S18 acetylase RimI-like enzyme
VTRVGRPADRPSATGPIIRRAAPDDLQAIETIVEDAYSVWIPRIGRRPVPMDSDYPAKVEEGVVYIAEDEVVVGLIVLIETDTHMLVENVAVAPGRQGTGVGRLLLDHAEKHARERGVSQLDLYTHAAMTENRALYRRLGYEEVASAGEDASPRVHFTKQLHRGQLT